MSENLIRIGLVFTHGLAYCRAILRGIKQYALSRPNWLFLPVAPEVRAVRALVTQRPQGVIAHVFTANLADALGSLRTPLVNVCGVLAELTVPRVGIDDCRCGQLAATHFLERGFRHFAFAGDATHAYSARREAGFRDAITTAGFAVQSCSARTRPFDPMGWLWSLDRSIRRWLGSLPRPVGVFTSNDIWGVQLSEACRQAGLRVPDDVALVGVDNDDLLCELARPALSSVAVPGEQIGLEAAALLDRLLAGQRSRPQPLLLPPLGVVSRQSSDLLALEDQELAAAVRFIRSQAHHPLRVRDVLRHVPVSRRTLERRFQAAFQRGVAEEIRNAHLERAKQLLAGTELPMPEVARQAGFTDSRQLSTVFRQETGLTPTAYRRQFRYRAEV